MKHWIRSNAQRLFRSELRKTYTKLDCGNSAFPKQPQSDVFSGVEIQD